MVQIELSNFMMYWDKIYAIRRTSYHSVYEQKVSSLHISKEVSPNDLMVSIISVQWCRPGQAGGWPRACQRTYYFIQLGAVRGRNGTLHSQMRGSVHKCVVPFRNTWLHSPMCNITGCFLDRSGWGKPSVRNTIPVSTRNCFLNVSQSVTLIPLECKYWVVVQD